MLYRSTHVRMDTITHIIVLASGTIATLISEHAGRPVPVTYDLAEAAQHAFWRWATAQRDQGTAYATWQTAWAAYRAAGAPGFPAV